MQGLCTGHNNPDLWFSDTTETAGRGRPSTSVENKMIEEALIALSICAKCPIKEACLAEGMKSENIDNGIWGGLLSGERIAASRINIKAKDRLNKISFARRVREKQFV